MNKLFKYTRFIIALILVLGAVGFSTSTALAAPPVQFSDSFTDTITVPAGMLCSFDVELSYYFAYHMFIFFNNDGTLTKDSFTQVEQDTWSANGKTLVSNLYHNAGYDSYDSDGNLIDSWLQGNMGMVRLPDGKIVSISAGRVNLLTSTGFLFSPDAGKQGDLDSFCAALAP